MIIAMYLDISEAIHMHTGTDGLYEVTPVLIGIGSLCAVTYMYIDTVCLYVAGVHLHIGTDCRFCADPVCIKLRTL